MKKKLDAGEEVLSSGDNSFRVLLMSDAATLEIGNRVPEWVQISLEERALTPTVSDAVSILMVNHDKQQGFKSEWTLTQQLTRIRQDLADYGKGSRKRFNLMSKNSGIFGQCQKIPEFFDISIRCLGALECVLV